MYIEYVLGQHIVQTMYIALDSGRYIVQAISN